MNVEKNLNPEGIIDTILEDGTVIYKDGTIKQGKSEPEFRRYMEGRSNNDLLDNMTKEELNNLKVELKKNNNSDLEEIMRYKENPQGRGR